jgi:hypothetical protein
MNVARIQQLLLFNDGAPIAGFIYFQSVEKGKTL